MLGSRPGSVGAGDKADGSRALGSRPGTEVVGAIALGSLKDNSEGLA